MNHFITLQEAIEMTALYHAKQEQILKPEYQQRNILARSETFEKAAFDTLLAKNGCAGLRVYYGMDNDLKIHAIIVAIDAKGNDILPVKASATSTAEEGEDIVERGIRCPDLCPTDSPLNS